MPSVPPKGLVVVTGANGYVASIIVQTLLQHGYRVRGTVRDASAHQWMLSHWGPDFELAEVRDMNVEGAFTEALRGVDGVCHTAINMELITRHPDTLEETAKSNISFLEAAVNEPSIKSFVLTSAQPACVSVVPGVTYSIDKDTYNNWAIAEVEKLKGHTGPSDVGEAIKRGLLIYAAAKARGEIAAWDWVEEHKPAFTFNVVVPNVNFGITVSPENAGFRTSADAFASVVKGYPIAPVTMPPQWYVDVEDTALLHLAALTMDGVSNERLMAMAGPYCYTEILEILHRRYPDEKSLLELGDEPARDCGSVENARSVEILKRLGKSKGFTSLEDTIVKAMDNVIASRSKKVPKSVIDQAMESQAASGAEGS